MQIDPVTSYPTNSGRIRLLSGRLAGVVARCAILSALLLSASANAQIIPKELPAPIRGLEMANTFGKQVPLYIQFTNEQGQIVSLKEYFNRRAPGAKGSRPVVVQMLYYRCPILCPQVLGRLTNTLNEVDLTVGKDFDVLLVSFDPRDTPADAAQKKSVQLISYNRSSQQTTDGWNFLTSSPENARALGEALGFPFRALPGGEFSHGAALFVLTPEGKVSRSLVGLNYPAADVKLAILEAGRGTIGTWADAFVLWCYHYDPNSGTYTVAAMRVMRAGGLLTISLVSALLLGMWRFEKRKRRSPSRFVPARSIDARAPQPLPPAASLTGSTP